MRPCVFRVPAVLLLLAVLLTGPAARALVQWDESRNLIHVNGTASIGWDSNLFATADGDGDTVTSAQVSLDYQRRAGLIGVDGTIGWDIARYADHADEDRENPFYRLELTKDSGRTTGSFVLGARRQSRAEPDANRRTDSWNYDSALHFRYPVIGRYSISGNVNYNFRDYRDNRVLVDLETYGAATDLYYVLNGERDLIAGYRVRRSETTANSTFSDHAFTVGLSGKILPKLNGTVRGGYQLRRGNGPFAGDDENITASGSATWSINRRASVTLQLAKDFSTTSTNVSIDSITATADALYIVNRRFSVGAGVGAGRNRFLSEVSAGREDTYTSASLIAHYTVMEGVRLNLSYGLYENSSTLAIADFTRHSISLSISSRF